jgi:Domain of unknown function (DUF397)
MAMSSNDNALNANWRKASYSNGTGSCVEAGTVPGVVLIRDTAQHGRGPVLRVTPADWKRFTATIKG